MRPERIQAAIIACHGNYQEAAELLGVNKTTMRDWIGKLRRQGYEIPKARGHLNRVQEFYIPTPEQLDEARLEIRRQSGLPDCEYDHARGNDDCLPPTQAEWDNSIGDGA